MPFTLAHPSAVLFLGKRLPLPGLVIGSIAPDFEYIFRLQVKSTFSHSVLGVLLFCLPIGLLANLFFESFVAPAFTALFPSLVQEKITRSKPSQTSILRVVLAISVGAFSHIIWDSFTQATGLGVQVFPILQVELIWAIHVYSLLQYFSGLLGITVILYSCHKWYRVTPPLATVDRVGLPSSLKAFILTTIFAFSILGGLHIATFPTAIFSYHEVHLFAVQAAIGSMAAFFIGVSAWSVVWRMVIFVRANIT